jgi:hypothetical protein
MCTQPSTSATPIFKMELVSKKFLPLPEAVELATGRRPHISTAMRWITRGSRGVVLESHLLGGRRLTTVDAVHRFVHAVTAASTTGLVPPPPETPHSAKKRSKKAADMLANRLKNAEVKNGR